MRRTQSVVSLDPIDRKNRKNPGVIGRMLMTKHFKGKGIKPLDKFGFYGVVGPQGSGKTLTALWYYEFLKKKYEKKHKGVILYSNMGLGVPIAKYTISPTIRNINYDPDTIHIFIIDEIQSYFPKDTKDPRTLAEIDKLVSDFSQLRKRSIYVIATAQIYGRINKSLREQALYMINCRKSKITSKIVSDFIPGDDILCDDLGRWSGSPVKIMVHGLPETVFDTHKLITE